MLFISYLYYVHMHKKNTWTELLAEEKHKIN